MKSIKTAKKLPLDTSTVRDLSHAQLALISGGKKPDPIRSVSC